MKRITVLFVAIFLCQVSFSQKKVINLIITIDREIVENANTYFVIVDTISNKNDTIRADYYPGHLSIEETDFNRIMKNYNVIFYIGKGKYVEGYGYISRNYEIDFRRKWFSNAYSLLHIYNQNKKWYKKGDSKKFGVYIYEFYTPEGYVLIQPRPTFLRRLLFKDEFKWW